MTEAGEKGLKHKSLGSLPDHTHPHDSSAVQRLGRVLLSTFFFLQGKRYGVCRRRKNSMLIYFSFPSKQGRKVYRFISPPILTVGGGIQNGIRFTAT
jgi:hypothetical protein